MHFEFFTYLIYSPRGISQIAIESRKLEGSIKKGDPAFSNHLAGRLIENGFREYFNDSILVPVPRSTPLVEGAVLPSGIIAKVLSENGLGNGVAEIMVRKFAIPKSSSNFSAETRNHVSTHIDSLELLPILIPENNIIIIDDILTLGRTAMACAILLQKQFPEKNIKIFCPMRTRSFNEPESLVSISRGFMESGSNDNVRLPD